jgi:DNA primase
MSAVKRFGLGYSPRDGGSMLKHLTSLGFTPEEIQTGYFAGKNERGYYDYFRGRVMFPIIDVQGNVIAFGGRVLDDSKPKYLNTSDTPAFRKTKNLFALNYAKNANAGYFILCEGYMDVITLHDAGFGMAVASLGTAVTEEQARIVKKYVQKVILSYDSDEAGQKAADRAIGILEKAGVEPKVLRMSGAKDPDEFIKLKGPEAFRKLIEGSENQVEYRLAQIAKKYDLSVDAQKVDYLREAEELLARLPGAAEREVYCRRVAAETGVSPEVLIGEVKRRRTRLLRRTEAAERASPVRDSQPSGKTIRYDDPASAVAEEGLIRLLCLEPSLAGDPRLPDAAGFSSAALGHIYGAVRGRLAAGKSVSADVLSGELSGDELSLLVNILGRPEALSNSARALDDYINRIEERRRAAAGGQDLMQILEEKRKQLKEG